MNKDVCMKFLAKSQQCFFSKHACFIDIDKISIELHTFHKMPRFVPYHSYSKISKKTRYSSKNLAHIKRQSVFLIETLCNDT